MGLFTYGLERSSEADMIRASGMTNVERREKYVKQLSCDNVEEVKSQSSRCCLVVSQVT